MNYKLTPPADQDLFDIWLYIAKDNPASADRFDAKLRETLRMLGDNPFIGHIRPDITAKPFRFWSVHSRMIIYNPDSSPMEIIRILSGYRDITTII